MKRLEKIIQLTTNIYKLYQDLINMELQGLNNNPDYEEKIEILKMYKELEDKYYKELACTYNLEQMQKLTHILNVDNLTNTNINDLDFILQELQYIKDEDIIIKRRVINKLMQMVLEKTSEDILLTFAIRELFEFHFERENISLGASEVIKFVGILNILNISERAGEIYFTRYIFFIEEYIKNQIFSKNFINQKYILSFINYHVEDKMVKVNFNVDENFIRNTKDKEKSPVEQEIYNFCLDKNATNSLRKLIHDTLTMNLENITNKEYKLLMYELQSLFRANLVEINETIKVIICMTLDSLNNGDNEKEKIMRKELSNIIRESKKDKEYL